MYWICFFVSFRLPRTGCRLDINQGSPLILWLSKTQSSSRCVEKSTWQDTSSASSTLKVKDSPFYNRPCQGCAWFSTSICALDAGPTPAFYLADGKLNFVKVRCFSSFTQSGLEDVVRPRALLALGNLQLRGQSIVPTPVVYAGDLTVLSTNPKEAHLQESLSHLRSLVQVQSWQLGSGIFYLFIFFK